MWTTENQINFFFTSERITMLITHRILISAGNFSKDKVSEFRCLKTSCLARKEAEKVLCNPVSIKSVNLTQIKYDKSPINGVLYLFLKVFQGGLFFYILQNFRIDCYLTIFLVTSKAKDLWWTSRLQRKSNHLTTCKNR